MDREREEWKTTSQNVQGNEDKQDGYDGVRSNFIVDCLFGGQIEVDECTFWVISCSKYAA